MKSKFLVINKEGEVIAVNKYRSSDECSPNMAICIDREALGISVGSSLDKPLYLQNAKKLGFMWEENASIGFLQYDYKANLILRLVKEYARHLVYGLGLPIYEVSGSNFFDLKHPVVEAYASLFGDRLFRFKSKEDELVMSYDASYPQFNLAGKYHIREDQLPFAHFSISDCYRYEQSGECMVLFRGKRFNMPDIHPYFKNLDEAWDWYPKFEKQIEAGFKLANRDYVNVAKVSSEANWEKFKSQICEIAKRGQKEMLVEIKMDGADRYWIVDIDYSFIDAFGQVREIGCIQIDVGNASRLGIKYQKSDGSYENPVIIHSAIPGGIERYIYMLVDDMSNFPIYFQAVQLRLIPVSQKFEHYAKAIVAKFPELRIDIDDRAESVSKKIKQAREDLVSNYVVIGEKEIAAGEIPSSVQQVVDSIKQKLEGLPKVPVSMPVLVSQAM